MNSICLCFQQVGKAIGFYVLIGYQLLGCFFKPRDDLLAEKNLSRFALCLRNKWFFDGRTTGIEPARGGFTIHCLDPLGYIRPYPRTEVSIYDQILSEPTPMTAIKEKLFPISLLLCFGIRLKPWLQQSIPIAWQSFKGWAVHFIHFTSLKIQVKIGGRRAVKAHLVDSERAASTYS